MASKFGKDISAPELSLELGAELEGWRKFIRRFEIAVIGAGLSEKRLSGNASNKEKREAKDLEKRKAALLLDRMGEVGMNVFESWDMDIEELDFQQMKTRFEEHFTAKENILATRHRFFSMEQEAEETMDMFVERTERASRSCRLQDREEMVVLVVVKGMKEDKLRKELLLKRELNLDKLRDLCNQYESAMAASRIISKSKGPQEVEAVTREQEDQAEIQWVSNHRGRGRGNATRGRGGRSTGTVFTCHSCGGTGHMARSCPSPQNKTGYRGSNLKKGACFNCGDEGHFARQCPRPKDKKSQDQQRRVNVVGEGQSDSSDSSL